MKIRKNLKSGNAIVIALLVALVIGLIVALTITIVTLVKINNSNSDKNPNNEVNNGIVDDTNKEDEKNNNDEEKFDPYAKYTDMIFAIDTTNGVVNMDAITWNGKYKVQDGVLYFTSNSTGKTTKVEGISGKVTKIIKGESGGGDQIAILTDKVITYIVDADEIDKNSKKDLSKYNVIDMTYVNKNGGLYYLTKDGNLIDKNGSKYDETANPYAKYNNMIFAIDTTNGVVNMDAITWNGKYKVQDGVLYFTSNSTGKTTKVEGISGKVTKIIKGESGGGDQIAILTDKVITYIVDADEIDKNSKKDLSKYNVIDMTYVNKNGGLYYLTKDGNLIDKNGLKYVG